MRISISAYDAAICRVERAVADLAQPLAYVPVAPPEAGDQLPDVRSSMPNGMFQQAVEVAKELIVAGDIFQVVLSQRYDIDLERRPLRLLPRSAAGQPESVHVLPQASRHHHRRQLARANGAGTRPQGDQPADRGHPPAGPRRRRRPAHGRRAQGEPERGRRAHHARRPGAQRRRSGSPSSARFMSTSS